MSRDHRAIETVVGAGLGFKSDIGGFVSHLKKTAGHGDVGPTVQVAGPAASAADQIKIFNGIDSTLLYATLAVVIVLLLVTYRSPVLWLLPMASAATVIAGTLCLLVADSADISGLGPVAAIGIGVGVGCWR